MGADLNPRPFFYTYILHFSACTYYHFSSVVSLYNFYERNIMKAGKGVQAFFCVSLWCVPLAAATDGGSGFIALLLNKIEQSKSATALDLPGISQLQLPAILLNVLSSVTIGKPEITMLADGINVRATATFKGTEFDTIIIIQPTPDGVHSSIAISLPNGWKLSNMFPHLAKLDIFSLDDVHLIIANHEYVDKNSDITIQEGANLSGTLVLNGPLQYLTHLIGQDLDRIHIGGHITPNIIGSSFTAKIPGTIDFIGGITAQDLESTSQW